MVRLPHYARHARTAELEPPAEPSLPIRSAERRRWSAELVSPAVAGLVLHGVGGIGKSVLGAQIAERVSRLEPDCVTTTLNGEVTADALLAGSAAALRRHPEAAARGGSTAEAVAAADRTGLPWAQRLALLRRHVLDQVPLLLVLDNFDDNLSLEAGTCTIRDPSLIEFLTSWAGPPHRGRLLITCRHRFAVPEAAASRLGFRHLGPLSRSGAIELAMSRPALGLLGEQELDRTWRLLAVTPGPWNTWTRCSRAAASAFRPRPDASPRRSRSGPVTRRPARGLPRRPSCRCRRRRRPPWPSPTCCWATCSTGSAPRRRAC